MATPILPSKEGTVGSIVELIDYLSSLSLNGFSEELRKYLFSVIRVRSVKKYGYLLEEGEVAGHIYFIRRGILRCFYKHKDRRDEQEVTAWVLPEPNVVVAVHSFYRQQPGFEIIQAVTDAEVYYISHEELEKAYRLFPEFERVGRLLTIEYLIFWSWQLFNLRMHTAEERFVLWFKDNADMLLHVQQKMIASYLNMDWATFSRIRSKYAK